MRTDSIHARGAKLASRNLATEKRSGGSLVRFSLAISHAIGKGAGPGARTGSWCVRLTGMYHGLERAKAVPTSLMSLWKLGDQVNTGAFTQTKTKSFCRTTGV